MWYIDLSLLDWLLLAALGYVLVTAVLYIAASWVEFETARHDRAIEARRRHLAKHRGEPQQSDVEITS